MRDEDSLHSPLAVGLAEHSLLRFRKKPLSANRVIGVIERRVAGLTDHPEIGYQSDQLGVRIILAIPYPYRIYYRVRGEEIAIVHVRHTARRLPAPDEL